MPELVHWIFLVFRLVVRVPKIEKIMYLDFSEKKEHSWQVTTSQKSPKWSKIRFLEFWPLTKVIYTFFSRKCKCSSQIIRKRLVWETSAICVLVLKFSQPTRMLKGTLMQIENLPTFSFSHKNTIPKVSHYDTLYFLKYTHPRHMKCLFTNIQKQ